MTNGVGAEASIAQDFAYYDRLPKAVKEFYQNAPFNSFCLTAIKIQRQWTLDPDELLEEMQERMRTYQNRMTYETYGPDHPQYRKPDDV